jgi:four helix bundle protein
MLTGARNAAVFLANARKTDNRCWVWMLELKKKIKNFKDLEIYQKSYKMSITIIKQIIPKLPHEEKFDLGDQLRRSVKTIPRLIAEGYSKRHQRKGFQRYLDDALAESNETIVSLSQVRDIYNVEIKLCTNIIKEYEIISKQIHKLSTVWVSFTKRKDKVNL